MQAIKRNRRIIASPVIDTIDWNTFELISDKIHVGGFDWNFRFKWDVLTNEQRQAQSDAYGQNLKTPTIAGGLFAIDTQWFRKIGEYDDKMEIWGSENIEISFRAWLCGDGLDAVF